LTRRLCEPQLMHNAVSVAAPLPSEVARIVNASIKEVTNDAVEAFAETVRQRQWHDIDADYRLTSSWPRQGMRVAATHHQMRCEPADGGWLWPFACAPALFAACKGRHGSHGTPIFLLY
jgi:hypothetical protein